MRIRRVLSMFIAALAAALAACDPGASPAPPSAAASPSPQRSVATPSPSPGAVGEREDALPRGVRKPPRWLGTRVLERGPSGYGIATETPPILRNRRFATEDVLPPPRSGRFESTIGRVPPDVLRRSSWKSGCPVGRKELAYVTVSFWGFDRRPHTGELIVHRSAARDIAGVFEKLYRARWPIEEMRITRERELDAPPTGDGNNTGAFACRPSRSTTEWSEHASGLAVDVNPFQNPYVRDGIVLPELALAYRDREWRRPGMIRQGDVVTRAFAAIGWSWGGEWNSAKDWMHFSRSGR